MPSTQRNKPALQPFRWPSTRAIVDRESTEALTVETLPRYNNDLSRSSDPTIRDTLFLFIQSTQKLVACLIADPEFTRSRVFRFSAPIVVFLSFLTTIALLPQNWYINRLSEAQAIANLTGVGFLCMVALTVVIGALSFLWILIWVLALSFRRFMEVDISGRRRTSVGIFHDLLGGLFTN
ncbi:hypothetical protein J3R30DRAFT_3705918 [Lentinula aciculospora]|uniref:Uncharacterized protein n=1 Tax=Lentinula aciculospora TaxID=153920 RepID=A0A9W9DM26_9AGAR|nr:hypothetical protein J3R30DRAFT_3705918 [Lentinula aciculospora]